MRIAHSYHHCRLPMTSKNHLSFGVEPSDCQIQPRGSRQLSGNVFQFEGNSRSVRHQVPSTPQAQ